MSRAPTVALAVSGHGYGHSVRCAQVAQALMKHGARVLLRTDAPVWLYPAGVEPLPPLAWPLDIGVAQHDGLDLDIDETRRRWTDFASTFDEHAAEEARVLREHKADVLLGDIPPLGFAAAQQARRPAVALGNFGWDWIYAAWPDFEPIVRCVQYGYRQADLLLKLPLHATAADAFQAFARAEDVPLIARCATRPRAAVRTAYGLPFDKRVVLLSFGGFDARGIELAALARATDYQFVLTPPLSTSAAARALPDNVLALTRQPAEYVSLLAACDAVVSKPGYGIVADCLANRVPMLYTDRGPFREYDVLVEALHQLGRARYAPRQDILDGNLAGHLDVLLNDLNDHSAWRELRLDGAEVVARRVLELTKL